MLTTLCNKLFWIYPKRYWSKSKALSTTNLTIVTMVSVLSALRSDTLQISTSALVIPSSERSKLLGGNCDVFRDQTKSHAYLHHGSFIRNCVQSLSQYHSSLQPESESQSPSFRKNIKQLLSSQKINTKADTLCSVSLNQLTTDADNSLRNIPKSGIRHCGDWKRSPILKSKILENFLSRNDLLTFAEVTAEWSKMKGDPLSVVGANKTKAQTFSNSDFSVLSKTVPLEPATGSLGECPVQKSRAWDNVEDLMLPISRSFERSPSKVSCCSDSGISTMYTSTPIKNPCEGHDSSTPGSPANYVTLLEARPGIPLSQTSSVNLTTAAIYDESLAQILETGDEEFRIKYSSWVSELFRLHLTKMHRRVCHHFHKKIQKLEDSKNEQLVELQRQDKCKLLESEKEKERLRKLNEVLAEENRRLKATKDAVVEEMKKVSQQGNANFEAELEQRLNDVRAVCENEKLQLQQHHGNQLKIFLDKSCRQIEKVENEYQAQVAFLKNGVQNLKVQNDTLEEQLNYYKRLYDSGGPYALRPALASGSYCFRKEKEHLLSIIQDLKNKLYDAEKEKLSIVATWADKIEALNSTMGLAKKDFLEKLKISQRNLELLQETKDNEIQLMKAQLAKQAQESQDVINGLRDNYGTRIQSLLEMVERLQIEMDVQDEKCSLK